MELPSQFTEISFNSNIKNTATIRNIKMTEIEVNYSFAISSMWFSAKLKHLNKYKVIFFKKRRVLLRDPANKVTGN